MRVRVQRGVVPAYELNSSLEAWICDTTPRAIAYARSLVSDHHLAEDLVHDCYCRLLAKRAEYDLPNDGTKLLFKAITNAAINATTRGRHLRSLDVHDADGGSLTNEVADKRSVSPLAKLTLQELQDQLGVALAKLPIIQRAAIELKSQGYSTNEIADSLGVTASHVAVLIYRARESLADILAPVLGSEIRR